MQKRIHQIITSLKEHTSISISITYAKIAILGGHSHIKILLLKATSPDDIPFHENYLHQLLKIFSISPSSCRAFTVAFGARFNKTRAWRVALKCLLLLHRLLRALPNHGDIFRAELLWARANGELCLYPCNFRDSSSSASKDYTAFVRSYARLLDEALDCSSSVTLSLIRNDHSSVVDEDKVELKVQELGRMIEVLPQVQSLIDRVIDCRPAGAAARSFLVHSAMKHVIRDSFLCYTTFRKEMVVLLENLIQLPYRSCAAAFGIYKKAAYQADHLSEFLDWSKTMGYCGSYEYPFVDRIPKIQIRALEAFLNGMWQLTDESSNASPEMQSPVSLTWTPTESLQSPASLTLTPIDGGEVGKKGMEMEALIEWEGYGWEDLLEASVSVEFGNESDQVFSEGQSLNNPFRTTNPFY
ncbi:putative clathrin assembly protein At2g25430 [Andrographis paniculata]|uniref:putative clathrin assembly protein At2g25430 n=1 Tax=Andrographis paniculata TaxID=175694 RepID=UPI0021E7C61B|nr:putative clathrin assembly protein At2g25430 [Andrographis paniculata]